MKNILIIGGSGTISSSVVDLLAYQDNVNLFILNRGLKKSTIYDNVKYLKGDFKNFKKIFKVLEDFTFDIVINFIVMDINDARNNYKIFKNKTKLFVFISTVCVLDGDESCVIKESNKYGNKYSLYAKNKEECEKFFMKKYRDEGFPISIIRPSQTYANDRIPLSVKGNTCYSVIDRMLNNKKVIVHGDGQSIWASTHANDFALGFVDLILNHDLKGEIYQIVNNDVHTWDDVYKILAKLLKVEYQPVYISSEILQYSKQYDFKQSLMGDKRWSKYFDNSKLLKKIVFKKNISLEKGLKKYLEYMNLHEELKLKDESFDKWCDNLIAIYEAFIKQIKDKI